MSKVDLHRLVDALPDDVLRRIENACPVTFVVASVGGRLELREIDSEQAWFWTPVWQAGECEADAELVAGLGTIYNGDEDFVDALEAELKPLE